MEMFSKSIPVISVTVTITSKFPPGGIGVTGTETMPTHNPSRIFDCFVHAPALSYYFVPFGQRFSPWFEAMAIFLFHTKAQKPKIDVLEKF
jgi:hypothetical protein